MTKQNVEKFEDLKQELATFYWIRLKRIISSLKSLRYAIQSETCQLNSNETIDCLELITEQCIKAFNTYEEKIQPFIFNEEEIDLEDDNFYSDIDFFEIDK